MTKYAVGYSEFVGDMKIEVVTTDAGWYDALIKHSSVNYTPSLPKELDEAKEVAITECGFEFDVVEV